MRERGNKMKLSTQNSNVVTRLGFEEGNLLLRRAGYDAVDMSLFSMIHSSSPYLADNWREYTEAQRRFADEHGIVFNQAHAPFSFHWEDPNVRDNIAQPSVLRSIEVAAILGADTIVVHPLHYRDFSKFADEMHEENLAYYRSMIPLCRDLGIKVAVENMWQMNPRRRFIDYDVAAHPEELAAFIDELDSEWVTACLDLGHCGLVGEDAAESIRILGHDRLGALHVHDNNFREDTHTLPGIGQMDWSSICRALHDIDYVGEFTYEADSFLKNFRAEQLVDAAAFMVTIGRGLIAEIERE